MSTCTSHTADACRGPDLGVQLQLLGGEYYQVILPKGSGWKKALDLRGLRALGKRVDPLRICTPPLGTPGRAGVPGLDPVRAGADLDAVEVRW